MVYMVTFTINIPQMLAYIPYMDPMDNAAESMQLSHIGRGWDFCFIPFGESFPVFILQGWDSIGDIAQGLGFRSFAQQMLLLVAGWFTVLFRVGVGFI